MAKLSKQKGAEWERAVCKRLSLWVSNMTREDIFWRSAMSGGRATFATRKGREADEVSAQAGDISAISSEGELLIKLFFIECKNYASLKLETLVYGTVGLSHIYWDEPLAQAKKYGKLPMVVAKESYQNPIMMTTKEGYDKLNKALKPGHTFHIHAIYPQMGMYVVSFRDVLGSISYEKFKEQNS